jgi:transcriptional regulator with XRE-family HTH domain
VEHGIGEALRKARNRRKLTLSEVEATIKVRVGYLRAIENEDWEALPGGSYTRAFIRTYANHLGLDGERLAAEHSPQPEAAPAVTGAGERRRLSPRSATALVVVAVVALALAVGIATGGGGGEPSPAPRGLTESSQADASPGGTGNPAALAGTEAARVELSLVATAEVWVCVLDSKGRALVDGQVLPAGEEEGPFHSGSFTVAFGNGEVAMRIDGKDIRTPASASPLGYSVEPGGHLARLSEAERPTCL